MEQTKKVSQERGKAKNLPPKNTNTSRSYTSKKNKKSHYKPSVSPDEIEARHISDTRYMTLKWLAIVFMIIDHIALFLAQYGFLRDAVIYESLRGIGRISFPIFAFLLVECYKHTANKKKHLLRLGMLATISEIPYDFALYGTPIRTAKPTIFESQNVIISFFLAFLMMWIIDVIPVRKLVESSFKNEKNHERIIKDLRFSISVNLCLVSAVIAYFTKLDWGWEGIVFIWLLKEARERPKRVTWTVWALILLTAFSVFETTNWSTKKGSIIPIFILLSLPIILSSIRENKEKTVIKTHPNKRNKRKKGNKKIEPKATFFDVLTNKFFVVTARYFYPAHLALIGILNIILGACGL